MEINFSFHSWSTVFSNIRALSNVVYKSRKERWSKKSYFLKTFFPFSPYFMLLQRKGGKFVSLPRVSKWVRGKAEKSTSSSSSSPFDCFFPLLGHHSFYASSSSIWSKNRSILHFIRRLFYHHRLRLFSEERTFKKFSEWQKSHQAKEGNNFSSLLCERKLYAIYHTSNEYKYSAYMYEEGYQILRQFDT